MGSSTLRPDGTRKSSKSSSSNQENLSPVQTYKLHSTASETSLCQSHLNSSYSNVSNVRAETESLGSVFSSIPLTNSRLVISFYPLYL